MEPDHELVLVDAAAWERWLVERTDEPHAWLVLARKGTTEPTSVTYDQALELALCHGWIDGQVRSRDTATYLQRFTPRRARSPWSARHVGLVERLVAEGRMRAGGQAEVDRTRADGRWDAAYAGPATTVAPPDLLAALAAHPPADALWAVLTSQNRFTIVHRVEQAKRADTRARRIADLVAMLGRGETLHPQRRRPGD